MPLVQVRTFKGQSSNPAESLFMVIEDWEEFYIRFFFAHAENSTPPHKAGQAKVGRIVFSAYRGWEFPLEEIP
jgi:hypothetical protein